MVTPTLTANALILMSVNSFVPIPMMIPRSVIDARKAPFAQIILEAMNAQDYGLANGYFYRSVIFPVLNGPVRDFSLSNLVQLAFSLRSVY